jgi:hypothetical protein
VGTAWVYGPVACKKLYLHGVDIPLEEESSEALLPGVPTAPGNKASAHESSEAKHSTGTRSWAKVKAVFKVVGIKGAAKGEAAGQSVLEILVRHCRKDILASSQVPRPSPRAQPHYIIIYSIRVLPPSTGISMACGPRRRVRQPRSAARLGLAPASRPFSCAGQIGRLVEFKWTKYGHATFNHKLFLAVVFTCLLLLMTVAGKPHPHRIPPLSPPPHPPRASSS